jgi:deoxyribonuclease IV
MRHNRVGVHIRMRSSLQELIEKADALNLPFFQCFFVPQELGRLISVSKEEIDFFLRIRQSRFKDLLCHVSYWVNLSSLVSNGFNQLRREISFAQRLDFNHFVLHPGTAKGAINKIEGIEALAQSLNKLFMVEPTITLILENGCHGNLAIGSDINDFKLLLERVNYPERINFCIDTAHAYSFGYNIADDVEQENFITLLDQTIGIERIMLIHLNDTAQMLGSCIDRHSILGAGVIGENALRRFAMHAKLAHIPLLLELPEMPLEEERVILNTVRSWSK